MSGRQDITGETRHRMTRRRDGWDYAQRAIYMVTLTLEDRSQEWLGNLAKNGEARNSTADRGEARNNTAERGEARNTVPAPSSVPAHFCAGNGAGNSAGNSAGSWYIAPTAFGEAALEALAAMPRLFPQVRILERQLMPEHLHLLLFVTTPLPKPLGAIIRGFKAGCAKRWREIAQNLAKNGEARNTVPAHFCAGNGAGSFPCWAEGFQDTILFREGQLQAMAAYIRANPARLAEKRANPGLFRRVARLALPLDGGELTGEFEALGNRHLLERPLHQVQCSRDFFAYRRIPKPRSGTKIATGADGEPVAAHSSPEYAQRLEAALSSAANGAVALSPCISDGERQIAREIFKRGLPLVAMRNMGFSPLEKPHGRSFDACAEGRLLLLAPAAWPHQTQEKPMTRFDATALNRICQWLAGEAAAQINYHGMRPADIDGLARKAVNARATT